MSDEGKLIVEVVSEGPPSRTLGEILRDPPTLIMGGHMKAGPLRYQDELEESVRRGQAALTTSQADVARLRAELTESVRALAVSQGEVERLTNQLFGARGNSRAANAECAATMAELARLCGDLELARGLLGAALERMRKINCTSLRFQFPHNPCDWCLFVAKLESALAPPTPTATPAAPHAGAGAETCRECGTEPSASGFPAPSAGELGFRKDLSATPPSSSPPVAAEACLECKRPTEVRAESTDATLDGMPFCGAVCSAAFCYERGSRGTR